MRIRRSIDDKVDINLTPIIDMVFLLLIFFLTATKFADIERDVRVDPPSSRNARPVTAMPQEIVINVARDGKFLVGGVERGLEELDALLNTAMQANPHQSVVVRGDRAAMLQYAVDVLDLCERHGIRRTYLTTRRTGG